MNSRTRGWIPWRPTRPSGSQPTRDYGVGLQILQDLGLTKVRLLTNNPKKVDAFVIQGHGLQVVDQVPIIALKKPNAPSTSPRNAIRWAIYCRLANGPGRA